MLTSNAEGLKPLHQILIKARFRAFERDRDSHVGKILDTAEYLLMCVLNEEDETEMFRSPLQGLGERLSEFTGIASNYPTLSPESSVTEPGR